MLKLNPKQTKTVLSYCRTFDCIYHIPKRFQSDGSLLICFENILSGKRKFYKLDQKGILKPYKFKGGGE